MIICSNRYISFNFHQFNYWGSDQVADIQIHERVDSEYDRLHEMMTYFMEHKAVVSNPFVSLFNPFFDG